MDLDICVDETTFDMDGISSILDVTNGCMEVLHGSTLNIGTKPFTIDNW